MNPVTRHLVIPGEDARYETPPGMEDHGSGLTRWSMIDHTTPGAVHTGFGVSRLDPGGRIESHLHSFEETFYVLEGSVIVDTPEASVELIPGDYGTIPVGVPHHWRNSSDGTASWADLLTPQPRPWFDEDTFLLEKGSDREPIRVDPRDPRTRSFGHIDPGNMDPGRQTQDMLAVSASMRTALLVYSGITVKMMSDTDLGAQLSTMFMVQYEPRGMAGAHDHPLEETYLILDGEVDAVFDGVEYRLKPGDVAFAGVGAVHEFSNPTDTTVRWLETQSPAPPARHSYRFARDWNYLGERLAE
ncbi:MAG TPA: cupin domain-containing protein [Acidimicrobiia bacterium]|nr:cupin domain-containing protein [Acidimicrobiia bacterium]